MSRPSLDRWWVRALFGAAVLSAVLVLLVMVAIGVGSSTDKRIVMAFLINLIIAMGLQTFSGNSGVMSFGIAAFAAIGAYATALLTTPANIKATSLPDAPGFLQDIELGFFPATVVGVLVTMVIALAVGVSIVRLVGAAAAVATLGLLVIVHTVLSNAEAITRGAKAFYGIPAYSDLYVGLILAIAAIVVSRLLRDSNLGLGLRSSRDDDLPARASGVSVVRTRLVTWVAGAGIAAMGGALYAHYVLAILPNAFYFSMTFLIVTMVIVGGSSVTGAFVGAAGLSVLTEFLRRAENGFSLGPLNLSEAPGLTTVVLGLLIILTMIVRPNGLCGRWELDDWLVGRRRRARASVAAPEAIDSSPPAAPVAAGAAGETHSETYPKEVT